MAERTKQIISQLANGDTQAAVARELRISRQRIHQIIHQEHRRATDILLVEPRRNEYGVTMLQMMRVGRGWSLAHLACLIGMSPAWLCRIEKGKKTKLRNARRIAEPFGVPPGVLFVADDDRPADLPGA
jgi:transcriptional regulator with XRE-family HTH domain